MNFRGDLMAEQDATGWEWLARLINSDTALFFVLFDVQILAGNADPGKLAKILQTLQRRLERESTLGANDPSINAIRNLRENLFGPGDRRLPAKRAQQRLALRRKHRWRFAHYHDGL